jgi:hypothetical protein
MLLLFGLLQHGRHLPQAGLLQLHETYTETCAAASSAFQGTSCPLAGANFEI